MGVPLFGYSKSVAPLQKKSIILIHFGFYPKQTPFLSIDHVLRYLIFRNDLETFVVYSIFVPCLSNLLTFNFIQFILETIQIPSSFDSLIKLSFQILNKGCTQIFIFLFIISWPLCCPSSSFWTFWRTALLRTEWTVEKLVLLFLFVDLIIETKLTIILVPTKKKLVLKKPAQNTIYLCEKKEKRKQHEEKSLCHATFVILSILMSVNNATMGVWW